jgi:extracellular elastinolytic metalloproteinase
VFLTIHGKRHYLWRAVDQEGNILDILVQRWRDQNAAKTFCRKLLKGFRRSRLMSAMKRRAFVLTLLILMATGAGSGVLAQDRPAVLPARVYQANPGQFLAARANTPPAALLADFLRSRGASDATARSLRSVAEHRIAHTGMMHLRLEQEVAGLRVHDAYVKAAFNRHGELVYVIESLAPVPAAAPLPARIDEAQALAIALRTLYPNLRGPFPMAGREGNTVLFAKRTFFYNEPRVEGVVIPLTGGALKLGFLVETWSHRGNQLHETLVDGDGDVLAIELRTNNDSYNIFPDHPGNSTQTAVAGPGAGNAESPSGWLFPGIHTSVNIAGNNVHAYLDTDSDQTADAGGNDVEDGNFLSAADLAAPPSTPINRDVAVQNLFYLNNLIHDTLYRHGFTETAGNFQEDNFGKGGSGGDSVNAEAQDGKSFNNADFTTPRRDGSNPRMQLFLFTDVFLLVNTPASIAGSYLAQLAAFGPLVDPTGVTGDVVLVDDGVGTSADACEAIADAVAGKIALIDRGNCEFTVKVKNAQNAGAIAAIVANNAGDELFLMDGTDPTITIPSVFISQTDGQTLRSVAGVNATIKSIDPPHRDSALDSDLVWHEYGHGLTWRMIGGMSGPLAGAIGEGMGDVLAILINEDDIVGEYLSSHPGGLRRAPYTNYPRTYGDVTGAEIHDDGEVYAAIGWRLFEIFQREGLTKELLLDYLVDGMNYTRMYPAFEDMRQGILAAVANAGTGHDCLIWEAFADYGVGVGARGRVRGLTEVVIRESFAVPAECSP